MRAERYPFELIEALGLRDGRRVLLRPIHPQDEPLTQSFVRGLSPRSRYQRFHNALRELPPKLLHQATHVDYQRHLALIAETFDGGAETEVGAARYVLRPDQATADFALVVADAWQGHGLGRLLLERLMAAARTRGLRRLEGDVLHDNKTMLALTSRLGFRVRRHEDAGLLVVSRDLQPEASAPALVRPASANLALAAA